MSPVPIRPAASLILLRDAPDLQALMGARPAEARAFPGATVFPGGKIDPQDHDAVWAARLCPGAPEPLAAAVAALRETFEETGVLLAHDAAGRRPGESREALAVARHAVASGELAFADLLDRWDLRLDGAALVPFARWVTPEGRPYRFDTWFFLASAPQPAPALIPTPEFASLDWCGVDAALQAHAAGAQPLMHPTRMNLLRLAESESAAEALAAAEKRAALAAGPAG